MKNIQNPELSAQTTCRLPAVQQLTGLSRSSLYARMSPKSAYFDATFPRPFPLFGSGQTRGAKGWRLIEVLSWLDAQASKR